MPWLDLELEVMAEFARLAKRLPETREHLEKWARGRREGDIRRSREWRAKLRLQPAKYAAHLAQRRVNHRKWYQQMRADAERYAEYLRKSAAAQRKPSARARKRRWLDGVLSDPARAKRWQEMKRQWWREEYYRRKNDPGYRAWQRKYALAYYHRRYENDPAFRAKQREKALEYYRQHRSDPVYMAKMREKASAYYHRYRNDPAFKAKKAEQARRYNAKKRAA